jgi:predicted transposase/invertase (TIGR01784 family)
MPKFTKTEGELQTQTDKWLYFIKHLSGLEDIPTSLREQVFEEAFQTAEIAQFSPAQIEAYESSLKYYRDMKNVIDTAIEEGEARGEERGRAEEKRSIARSLKSLGVSWSDIARATGLSDEEIQGL